MITHARMHGAAALLALGLACAFAALVGTARAGDRGRELIPEFNAYFRLSESTRIYLLADLTKTRSEGTIQSELGANFDLTLMPILRSRLREADWERDRYLWMRVGYLRVGSPDAEDMGPTERRGIVEATARVQLPLEAWLVNRARVDLRDIGGEFSRRYRLRAGVEREFTLGGIPWVPYVQGEVFYDTRYDAWNRELYQTGVEIELTKNWRIEPYVGRQYDRRSASGNVDSIGLVLKYYR